MFINNILLKIRKELSQKTKMKLSGRSNKRLVEYTTECIFNKRNLKIKCLVLGKSQK